MKSCSFISFLILIFLFKNTYEEEKSFLEKLIEGLTSVKKLNDTKTIEKNESKIIKEEDIEDIIEDDIYEMNSTKDFDLNIKINGTENNTLIILFYSESCIHCKRFLPIYREISEILKNDTNIKFSKIQFSLCEEILKKYSQIKIQGVPTVYLYQKGRFTRHEGPRNKENVMSFIDNIRNFKCFEISSLDELSTYINQDIIFAKDKEKNFVLGIFRESGEFDNNFIVNNFMEINIINSDIVMNKKCFYFFKNVKINAEYINKNNFYLKHALYEKSGGFGDYLIYSYNYQSGLNSFNLFGTFLLLQNNDSKINEFNNNNENINKNIKIIKNKYKIFLNENFLYKYYYINNENDLKKFNYFDQKLFIFYFQTPELEKFYIDEIKYILSWNHSLISDYLFILFNTTTEKVDKYKRVSFFNIQDYENKMLLYKHELNKTNLESKILEYINKDRKHLLKNKMQVAQETIKSIYDWLSNLADKNNSQTNLVNLNNDFEQELIDEINKTIIEDEKKQKLEEEKKINQSNNFENKNLKNLKNIQKRGKILDSIKDEDLGFNKNLIMFPLFLMIYSLLFFFCYKYVFTKFENKIFYKRLPTEDPKSK